MNNDMNGYGNGNLSPQGAGSSLWVGGAGGPIPIEPLVDQFGNLRFGNQIIPLTTPITPFLNPRASLPSLATPVHLNNNVTVAQPPGSLYIVSVQESPSPHMMTDPVSSRVQMPNLISPVHSQNVVTSPIVGQTPAYSVPNLQQIGNGNVEVEFIPPPLVSPKPHPIYGTSQGRAGVLPPSPVRHVSDPDRQNIPFRGQPYMRQISPMSSLDLSSPEQEVPPFSPLQQTIQPHVTELAINSKQAGPKLAYSTNGMHDGTDTSSMTSSTSVSPYNSMPSSPHPEPTGVLSNAPAVVYDPVPPRYVKPSDRSRCLMCDKTVYAMEKRGPIKDVLFHKTCFKCAVCAMSLDLKNFCQNDNDLADLNVYCKSHKPNEKFGKLDSGALSINRALSAPRLGQVNEQIRGGREAMKGGKLTTDSLNIKAAMNVPKSSTPGDTNIRNTAHSYQIDNQSVALVHARSVPATELQVSNKIREQAWSRDKRQAEVLPPPDVVRHDTEVKGYGEPYLHDPPPESSYR